MKKIIIVSAVFPPESIATAKTSESLASALVLRNYNVEVITNFPNRPAGKIHKGYKRYLYFSDQHAYGYKINRCFSTFSRTSSILSRLLENITFAVSSNLVLLFLKKPDVVYSNTWPIFSTGLTVLICKLRVIPIVVSVQDIYPESLFIQGRISENKLGYKLLIRIDRWIAKKSNALIFISEKQLANYIASRNIELKKTHVIPNWVQKNTIQLMSGVNYREEAGISPNAFLIVYGGNIGKASGLANVIKALKHIKAINQIVLLIAGSGSELTECQLLANQINKVKIIFHTPWAEIDTSKVLAAADLLLLPTQGNQSHVSVPSKMIAYMFSSKPILAIAARQSEICNLLESIDCGWVISSDNLEYLPSKIIEISESPSVILKEKGARGREYALENFTSEVALPKIISLLDEIVRGKA